MKEAEILGRLIENLEHGYANNIISYEQKQILLVARTTLGLIDNLTKELNDIRSKLNEIQRSRNQSEI